MIARNIYCELKTTVAAGRKIPWQVDAPAVIWTRAGGCKHFQKVSMKYKNISLEEVNRFLYGSGLIWPWLRGVGEEQWFCFPAVAAACVSGWIYSEGLKTKREGERGRVISLGFCTATPEWGTFSNPQWFIQTINIWAQRLSKEKGGLDYSCSLLFRPSEHFILLPLH